MIEIEIKARADHRALLSALKGAGATFEKTVEQYDTYFNAPDRDFGTTDEALRLREQSGHTYMTYKGKKLDAKSKTRKEVEIEVSDRTKTEDILLSLGYKKTLDVKKKRDIYHLAGVEACVDSVEGLGDYVELEAMAEDTTAVPQKRDMLIDLMRRLGVNGELIRESYLEMLLAKNH